MKKISIVSCAIFTVLFSISNAFGAVIPSSNVIQQQQSLYNTQQVLSLLDGAEVQEKLVSLGVNVADARTRVANMTQQELNTFNSTLNDMPAASGVVGTIVTVLVVLAVLDVMGITDVYSFIRPIN
ncbi:MULTISPECIES: PA2779 family protein [unclassified Colwellia]|jgi:hypothetical protein|uniref:PA2779 family protein n=1 Tax=unclassified Colwellia TaxID=196834 RepID=UPI0015F6EC25|nr:MULTISPECIES: PA2779 family protein [unclassified Colwellia]MBA6364234.1 PA2779 family protein [Colwellia sp. BRX8-8]MBA6337291.1 PA2779 family protein [Colwellia sp. BRX8-7]MBA6356593.1 PA2779 family protein [Colwellia sp. BRX8-3]MBA6359379.1 PA2779 family protein [Colwellia sp. BRX8-6]MBA6367991.1 PA2779 family protein [Colwellia sp. BRX8-5]|tara:strand:- start:494 stop:871 length:378 start_codon:yes stop_codon:yes gene_type:complete